MSFNQIIHRLEGNIDQEVRALTVGIFGSVIKMTPVDTGRAKGNWQCTIGSPASGTVETSGEDAAMSAMMQAVPDYAGKKVFLTNNLPYIQKLEYDAHSSQAPNGMVRVPIARFTS
jgi:hypothetical protein